MWQVLVIDEVEMGKGLQGRILDMRQKCRPRGKKGDGSGIRRLNIFWSLAYCGKLMAEVTLMLTLAVFFRGAEFRVIGNAMSEAKI